ncbi:MAG: hypothetical protein ACRCYR_06875, partial [Phycicoccus sp.]
MSVDLSGLVDAAGRVGVDLSGFGRNQLAVIAQVLVSWGLVGSGEGTPELTAAQWASVLAGALGGGPWVEGQAGGEVIAAADAAGIDLRGLSPAELVVVRKVLERAGVWSSGEISGQAWAAAVQEVLASSAAAGEAEQGAAGEGPGGALATGVGITDPVQFLNALLLEGALSQAEYEELVGDGAFLAELGKTLAAGGSASSDSAGQREMNRLLALGMDELQGILAVTPDLGRGPTGAQLLALYSLAGANDFALQEILINWLFVRHPGLELMVDPQSGEFFWVKDGVRVSSPFLAAVIDDLALRDEKLVREWKELKDCRTNSAGDDQVCADVPPQSVRPAFEWVNQDRSADLGGERVALIAAALGLPVDRDGYFVIPGGERIGFDVDDNQADNDKDATVDQKIVQLLRLQAPELMSGTDYFLVGDNADRRQELAQGGLGDDRFVQVGGNYQISGGGGDNDIVVLPESRSTVVDGQGNDSVVVRPSVLAGDPYGSSEVTVADTDDTRARTGLLDVTFLSDVTLGGDLTTRGQRRVNIAEGATVDIAEGGFRSEDDDGIEEFNVDGTLRGDRLVLGGGPDTIRTGATSTFDVDFTNLGDGDDLADLGGRVDGKINVGRNSDKVLIRDTITGDLELRDPASSWMYASGEGGIREQDQVFLIGDGFGWADPGDTSKGLVKRNSKGEIVSRVGLGADGEQLEQIAILNDKGQVVEQLQDVAPEIRYQGAWMKWVSTALKFAGFVSGQFYLTAAGALLDTAYTAQNGGNVAASF